MFSGEIGTPYRRTYTVMGDTVNLAARLMAKAPAGEIYATSAVLEGSRTTFETTDLEPFLVKGKKLPVEAVSVGEPLGSRNVAGGAGLPLIGRDEELALLTEAWAKALEGERADGGDLGRGRDGEEPPPRRVPGDQPTGQVVMAECRLYQATTAYFPFRALLRGIWELGDLEAKEAEKALTGLVDAESPGARPLAAPDRPPPRDRGPGVGRSLTVG